MPGEVYQLAADLTGVSSRIRQKADQAIRKAAADGVRAAKTLAAVDTGMMRNSITADTLGECRAEYGPAVHYAPYVEYGTHKMTARPFMAPSADAVAPGLIAALTQLGVTIT